jgi:hypothetical protein
MQFDRLVSVFRARVRGVWLLASLMAHVTGVVPLDESPTSW